jgi:Uma2 family endonuclease
MRREEMTALRWEEPSMVQPSTLPPLVRGEWIPMTYEEFLAWAPHGPRTEWRDGEGIVYMTNSDRHQALILLVASLLETFARLFGLGRVSMAPYAMLLRPGGPHREPDVLFVRTEHLDHWTSQRLHGPADLAVEVLSEDTASEDRGRKRAEYEALGVAEYLLLDARPGRQEFAYLRLDADGRYQAVEPDGQGRYHSGMLPGFWIDPTWFWQDDLPSSLTLLRRISPEGWRRLVQEIERDN